MLEHALYNPRVATRVWLRSAPMRRVLRAMWVVGDLILPLEQQKTRRTNAAVCPKKNR